MLTIDSWVSEGEFATANDKVVYTSLQGKQRKRVVRPDGYFSIMREGGAGNGFSARKIHPRQPRSKV